MVASGTEAAKKVSDSASKGKIVFVPHDNRPVSDEMAAETIRKLGYEVIVPPDELLGSNDNMGNPEKLWMWLEKNTTVKRKPSKLEQKRFHTGGQIWGLDPNIKAIVISADSMIYGSLVSSRKHSITERKLKERVANFADYKYRHDDAKLYVFSSVMRTPTSGENSGSQEPDYYKAYGRDIFRYTALKDKADDRGLNSREKKELEFLQELIPSEYLRDWNNRRDKNYRVNEALIDLGAKNKFECLVLGRDDNAAWSQTHMEARHLKEYSNSKLADRVQNIAGIDEMGLLLLTRAVNEITGRRPVVTADYNWGSGKYLIPPYSDEPVDTTVRSHVKLLGGEYVDNGTNVDLLLMVNTHQTGDNLGANWFSNAKKVRPDIKTFVSYMERAINRGEPVGVADVSFVNGSDNSLMEELRDRGMLYKLQSYSGWNTPTNSIGFALAQGVLAKDMKKKDKDELLTIRYMDDWLYQANIRQMVNRQLSWFKDAGVYSELGADKGDVERRATSLMHTFAVDNLPADKSDFIKKMQITCPWNRLFEVKISPEK
ncbi:hypothetical protein D081_0345 [Anaerovibrio sp. JC8]|nr:hypothetical protein D081_0345 [Anaerovibrio sp. JC8]